MTESMAIEYILRELDRARDKFPYWPRDKIHAAAIVAEESGELIRAAVRHHYESGTLADCRQEAMHTAAMAIRFLAGG